MRIKINISGRKSFWLEVEPYYSIRTVLRKIEYYYDIPIAHQIIPSKPNYVADITTFAKLNVKNEDSYTIVLDPEYFYLTCKISSGDREVLIHVKPSHSIKEVKQKIDYQANIPPKLQKIVLNGIEFKDDCLLSDYDVNTSSILAVNTDYSRMINDLKSLLPS